MRGKHLMLSLVLLTFSLFLFFLHRAGAFSNVPAKNEIAYKNFSLGKIIFTKYNNAYDVYDFIFPTLVRFLIINAKNSNKKKILKTIKFVNFYSTPGMFPRYKGLGTGRP